MNPCLRCGLDGGAWVTQETSTDLVTTLEQRASLAATLANPDLTLVRAAATYILYKRRRLSEASERGYTATLEHFTAHHPNAKLVDFEPPNGAHLVEDHLAQRYGHLAPRTYNRAHSVLSDFFKWHVVRGTLSRDPIAGIEPAKTRPVRRQTFSAAQVLQILEANGDPRDQIALRLLLFFGIRKGALRRIQLDHFDGEKRTVTITTKGGKIQTLQLVDDTIWQLLDGLREPGSNYLLPKRVTRRRIPPTRKHLRELQAALVSCSAPLDAAAVDAQCARELAAVRDTLDVAAARLTVALQVASTQTRLEHGEPIGEHRVLRRPCIRGCGRLAWHGRGSEGVCRRCRSLELSQSVRDDTLRCCECREWKPDASFPAQSARIARRGRHSVCRPCQTVARARARERQKTPCTNCGTLRLADPRTRDSGLCRPCWCRSLKKAAA